MHNNTLRLRSANEVAGASLFLLTHAEARRSVYALLQEQLPVRAGGYRSVDRVRLDAGTTN
eukprot:8174197-Heterocapsa_arctica.AAC.1